jgi:hypothetical protein
VGTNIDYTIRFRPSLCAVELELCYFSRYFGRRNFDFGGGPGGPTWTDSRLEF